MQPKIIIYRPYKVYYINTPRSYGFFTHSAEFSMPFCKKTYLIADRDGRIF